MVNPLDRDETPRRTGLDLVDDYAIESGVAANVLIALGERAGAQTPDDIAEVARRAAADLAPRLQAGERLEDMIRAAAGDEAEPFMARVRAIGEARYPEQTRAAREAAEREAAARREQEPGLLGDLGRQVGAGFVSGVGSAVEGLGFIADQPAALVRNDENYTPGLLARAGRAGGDWLREAAEGMRMSVSEDTRRAIADSTPSGDITDLSSLSFGTDPSLRGITMLTADVFGSFLPIVAASFAPGGAFAAAGVGAAQGAGAGNETGREIIEEAFQQRGEDGRSLLEATSPFFRELLSQGLPEERAFEITRDSAARLSGLFGGSVASIGGAVSGRILHGGSRVLNRAAAGPLERALVTGATSGLEEGAQEAAESIAGRYGVQRATGMAINLTEGTFGDFILGALGGGPVGAVSGALTPNHTPEAEPLPIGGEDDDPAPAPVDVPLPLPGPGAGGTVFGEGLIGRRPDEFERDEQRHGRSSTETAAQQPAGFRPQSEPHQETGIAGVVSPDPAAPRAGLEAAGLGRDETIRPGIVEVRLHGERSPWRADIIGETEEGLEVRDEEGRTLTIPRAEIESGEVEINPAFPPASDESPPSAATAAAEPPPTSLAYNEQQKEVRSADSTPLTSADARRFIEAIEERARRVGWDEEMSAAHAQLRDAIERDAPIDPAITQSEVLTITKLDGAPFGDEAAARRALGRLGASDVSYDIVPTEGGFIARPAAAVVRSAPGSPNASGDASPIAAPMPQPPSDAAPATDSAPAVEPPKQVPVSTGRADVDARGRPVSQWASQEWVEASDEDRAAFGARVQQTIDALPSLRKDPAFKANVLQQPFGDAHRESPVAVELAHGYRDGAAGRLPDMLAVSPSQQRGQGIEPYLMGYEAGRTGKPMHRIRGDQMAEVMARIQQEMSPPVGQKTDPLPEDFRDPAAPNSPADALVAPAANALASDDTFGPSASRPNASDARGPDDIPSVIAAPAPAPAIEAEVSGGDASFQTDPNPVPQTARSRTNTSTIRLPKASSVPLAQAIRRMGGIATTRADRRTGAQVPTFVAQELAHRGITPRTHPYLFNRNGGSDFDNIAPGSFGPDDAQVFGLDDTGSYLNREAIIDRLAGEVTGGGATAFDLAEDMDRRDAERAKAEQEREEEARQAVEAEAADLGQHLLEDERDAAIAAFMRGEDIADAIYDAILHTHRMRGDEDVEDGTGADGAEARQIRDVPFGNEPLPGQRQDDPRAATGSRAPEEEHGEARGGSEGRQDDPTVPDRVTTEHTEAGEQAVLPGAERDDTQARQRARDRQKSEIVARQQQSKMRRLDGNNGDAGPLFNTQGDMFAQGPSFVSAAAADTNPNPTPAQAEAENYKTGKAQWNGLTLSIENAKGSVRRKVGPTGEEWSVTMPAHYGRILRTEGADGDHVDFYMGPNEASGFVVIVNQIDPETGAFDEHKVVLGTGSRAEALRIYQQGFSDGSGKSRIGSDTATTLEGFKAWLATGDLTKPTQPISRPTQPEHAGQGGKAGSSTGSSDKITDFGEKIGGARKDKWGAFAERMQEAENFDISKDPLSKTWPEPKYAALIEEGTDPWAVAFVRAAREEIPRKPTTTWKLGNWARSVETLRGFAQKVLAGDIDRQRILAATEQRKALDRVDAKTGLYQVFGHAKSLKELTFARHHYSVRNGVARPGGWDLWEITKDRKATAFNNFPHVLASSETYEGAIDAFAKVYAKMNEAGETAATTKADRQAKFIIWTTRGKADQGYVIGTKIGTNHIPLRSGVMDVKEARRIVKDEADALQAQLDRLRDIPSERRDQNAPRVGVDHRAGGDVTPEAFQEAFGFRGVEFGNYVEGPRRQQDLNEAFDALHDLAGILDVPTKALSLNGTLGLAFGARGKGGKNTAAAHYEPGKIVINLTKTNGKGALAHEWFHAVDNYFARQRTPQRGTYITDNTSPGGPQVAGIRPEVVDAFRAVKAAINATGLRKRSDNIDRTRSKPYWGTGIEMHARAFESYVLAKLQDQGGSNDYLVNVVDGMAWGMLAEASGLGESFPYLTAQEIEAVRPAFDALFETIETRQTDRGIEMYSRHPGAEPAAILGGNELGDWSDVSDLQKKARRWYQENLQRTAVTNEETGWNIRFSRDGAGKIGSKGDFLLRVVPALREILAKATKVGEAPDAKQREGVKAFHYFQADVNVAGRRESIIVTVREMDDGRKFYDLSLDNGIGARTQGPMGTREARAAPDVELGADALNLAFARPIDKAVSGRMAAEADAAPTADDLRALAHAVSMEMRKHGLQDTVKAEVIRELHRHAYGVYTPAEGSISVRAAAARDTIGTLRHEIVHALRDATLWGRSHGLFTQSEWQGLVRAARDDRALIGQVQELYPDLGARAQIEEAVAELYRRWAGRRDQRSGIDRAFQKVRAFFQALANALRGRGFQSAALTMERIAGGGIGGRGPRGGASAPAMARAIPAESRFAPRRPDGRFASKAAEFSARFLGGGALTGTRENSILSQMLTDAMGGKSSRYNILALVPGEPLYEELAKNLPSARTYLKLKHAMSAMRNQRQAEAATVMDEWRGFLMRNRKANAALMDLMHEATIAGLDPAKPFTVRKKQTGETDAAYEAFAEGRRREHAALVKKWNALPAKAQEIYVKVRDAYVEVAKTENAIIEQNMTDAMAINLKRARLAYEDELTRIEEAGLEGAEREEAEEAAAETFLRVKKRDGYGRASRLRSLRLMLEQGRVDAPYFPLLRHGQYFVTVKDEAGKVVAFTKAETARAQAAAAKDAAAAYPGHNVITGIMGAQQAAPDVDPMFVADVEQMIGAKVEDPALMDAIWQRYLESLPDFSMRKSHMHRKGVPGFAKDAFRNYARQMFHSAHQLARLKHSMQMQMALEDVEREARRAADPNRAGAVSNEMAMRHQWIMNPQSSAWSTWATGAAFVYYLGMTPAAALVNLSQTVVVGIPVLAAGFKKGGVARASRELMRGLREFGAGRGAVEKAKTLTDDERAAMREAYDRGIVDKSQAHDLAGVSESGVEYSDIRHRIMQPISFFFHHAERLNREITFLAAYRMARSNGMDHDAAIDKAGSLTWKSHFNYESDARPRLQQSDFMRVLTVFRNFQLNMLYRLFRDIHQSFNGATADDRKEARAQLFGITGMMMMSAGVTGTWGYSLLMTLAGMFTSGGDADDLEKEVKNALVNILGRQVAGLVLNGVPGHLTGLDLTSRIGMPELWFRSPDRQMEGDDLYNYWAQQFLGAVPGMAQSVFRGIDIAAGGDPWRGAETAAPKFIRDLMRGVRYSQDGVTTLSGNPILEALPAPAALAQAIGFTPAAVAEAYERNSWMRNENAQIQDERASVLNAIWRAVSSGEAIPDQVLESIQAFNRDNPDYAIDRATIERSIQARRRGAADTVGGVRLNNRIEARIRAAAPVSIYGDSQ